MTKKERIMRATDEELRSRRSQGAGGSDWRRAARRPVPDGTDPDDAIEPVDMDWVTIELPLPRRKVHTSLRLDADMLEWFKAQGRGYQTRINAILRSYFERHTPSG